ncbi:hypothetical protein H310_11849 [Aphanomyces invadans]|uniref:Peptidase A1 domain-containing protein n=1 Tax=Aphanomyces invadans TaxID=157072 RepID=A0A024TLS0_9STRA|nr:hypothetical protein H310_11849 [Aphanomyces invadans]ETV94581.1 hypothetical protein H310_11849 [Aphanomyces invadans]|eukprot:XP_008876896.1 hypothetical protein H310_11849 [Aphanomyces invadans]
MLCNDVAATAMRADGDASVSNDGVLRLNLQRNVHYPTRRWQSESNLTGGLTIESDEVALGVGIGTHYAEMYLGLPPQKASVIIDTGSHMTALPCTSCIDCGDHTDPPYDMTKSTTANYLTCAEYSRCNSCESNNQCRVSQSYAEGSMWSALMVSELCWVGSLPAADGAADMNVSTMLSKYGVRFPIGCQTRETGLFISQKENGIMGMAQDPNTIVPYLVKSGVLKANMFSLCFADTGGTMVLGGVDTKLHLAPPMFTPLLTTSGWFTVEVLDILIGNVSLNVPPSWYNSGRGVIVDSGSTDSYMPSSVGSAFAALYKKMAHGVAYREDDAVLLHPADQRTLPAIQFVLRGMTKGSSVVLSLPPTQYYTTNADGTVANNVHFTQSSGGVLGAAAMANFDVIFDMANKRVGFAPARCDRSVPGAGDRQPLVSRGKWTDKTFWDSYGSLVTVLVVCSIVGMAALVLRLLWRRCRRKSSWTELAVDESAPTPVQHQVSPIKDDDNDVDLQTPASPQRKLSRSPDLHSIVEVDES